MFDTAMKLPPDRPEGWTVEDERLLAAERFRVWAQDPADPVEPVSAGWMAFELDADTQDPARLSDAELIDAMAAFERTAAWAEARQARMIAEFARRRPGEDKSLASSDRTCAASPFAPDEVGLALRLSRWAALTRIGQSVELVERLPETLELWEAGRLDERRVVAICDATRNLPVAAARAVQARVLARAPEQTLGQLKAALRYAVEREDPNAADRHRGARRDRRVSVKPEPDGMGSLWALLSAPDALACYQWLTRLARGDGADDPRGMDARRADLLVGLLTGKLATAPAPNRGTDTGTGADGGPDSDGGAGSGADAAPAPAPAPVNPGKPLVQVLLPFSTLLGGEEPGELIGYGTIPAEMARQIAEDATLKRLVFDPLSGALLDYGRCTYRPPAGLADHVRARDVYCRFPGCRRRVLDGELDHIIPFPTGPTSEANLAGYCPHHHRAKHATGWQVTRHPDGRLEWITPTGHRYFSEPYNYRLDDDPMSPLRLFAVTPSPQGPERSPPLVADDEGAPPF